MQTQNPRVVIAQSIVDQVMRNPEAAINFVCCVADEVSMCDLYRIQAIFLNSLKTIHNKMNLNN